MNHSRFVLLAILACSVFMFPGFVLAADPEAPITIDVPGDYATISIALEHAGSEDVIGVADGDYFLSDQIDVDLQGVVIRSANGPDNCRIIFDPNAWYEEHVFYVTADHVTIKGFTIESDNYDLIEVIRVEGDYCAVVNNVIKVGGVADAVKVVSGPGFVGKQNEIAMTNIYACGFIIMTSDNTKLLGNNIHENGDIAIDMFDSDGCQIMYNHIWGNAEEALHAYFCDEIFIYKNHIHDNQGGIYLSLVTNSKIKNNNIENNGAYGIKIYDGSSYNDVSNNKITGHIYDIPGGGTTGYGIIVKKYDDQCVDNEIHHNKIKENHKGISIELSGNNYVYLNTFRENTDNVYGWTSSTYHTPTQVTYYHGGTQYTGFLGNYYDDYTGTDADGDGVGTPGYSVYDDYPLMESTHRYSPTPQILLQIDGRVDGADVYKRFLVRIDGEYYRTPVNVYIATGTHGFKSPYRIWTREGIMYFNHIEDGIGTIVSYQRRYRFDSVDGTEYIIVFDPEV